jgi:uncharacterized membrane protein YphA (DoxX/SURF4 family)
VNRLLSSSYLVVAVRAILGLIFVLASIDKIADPAAFAKSIMNYKILSPSLAMLIATILPWTELLCGLALLCGVFLKGGSLLVFIMLVIFTAGVLSALARGLDISCGCFTQDPSAGKISWLKIGENTAMIVLSLFLFLSRSMNLSLDRYLHRQPAPLPVEPH